MTIKQAINILSSDTSFEAVKELQYYAGFDKDKVVEQIQEAMNMGAEALKKQIPKKVIKEQGECYAMTKDGIGRYEIIVKCPSCGSTFLNPNFPCKCGQKLDWE